MQILHGSDMEVMAGVATGCWVHPPSVVWTPERPGQLRLGDAQRVGWLWRETGRDRLRGGWLGASGADRARPGGRRASRWRLVRTPSRLAEDRPSGSGPDPAYRGRRTAPKPRWTAHTGAGGPERALASRRSSGEGSPVANGRRRSRIRPLLRSCRRAPLGGPGTRRTEKAQGEERGRQR